MFQTIKQTSAMTNDCQRCGKKIPTPKLWPYLRMNECACVRNCSFGTRLLRLRLFSANKEHTLMGASYWLSVISNASTHSSANDMISYCFVRCTTSFGSLFVIDVISIVIFITIHVMYDRCRPLYKFSMYRCRRRRLADPHSGRA